MLNMAKVMLVREVIEWDIHVFPWHFASFGFENMGDNIS
jgi:hypothetical protein